MFENMLYFLHLIGLTLWMGSMVLLVILLVNLRKNTKEWGGKPLFLLATKVVKWFLNIAALVVLGSGGALIQQLGYTEATKPFWIRFMEQGGGMILLLFIIIMTWLSNRATRLVRDAGSEEDRVLPKMMGRYSLALSVFAVLAVAVVFVVSMKIA